MNEVNCTKIIPEEFYSNGTSKCKADSKWYFEILTFSYKYKRFLLYFFHTSHFLYFEGSPVHISHMTSKCNADLKSYLKYKHFGTKINVHMSSFYMSNFWKLGVFPKYLVIIFGQKCSIQIWTPIHRIFSMFYL